MNADNCLLARGLVSPSYVAQGAEALVKRQKLIKTLLSQRRLPQSGWDDATIELFIQACRVTACDCVRQLCLVAEAQSSSRLPWASRLPVD